MISVALVEEESADECSCLLSVQSRGKRAQRCNNFDRKCWEGEECCEQTTDDKVKIRICHIDFLKYLRAPWHICNHSEDILW